jgi:hypothetical protein
VIGDNDTVFRLTIAAELVAMGGVRDYYFFFRSKESISERLQGAVEELRLTAAMGALALLHFGAVFVYRMNEQESTYTAKFALKVR